MPLAAMAEIVSMFEVRANARRMPIGVLRKWLVFRLKSLRGRKFETRIGHRKNLDAKLRLAIPGSVPITYEFVVARSVHPLVRANFRNRSASFQ